MDEPENQNKPKPVEADGAGASGDKEKPVSKMTPGEQMAAFEKTMKEDDWGHQPC